TDWSQLHPLTSLSVLNANGNWITEADDNALSEALPGCTIYAGLNGYLIYDITIAGTAYSSDVTELDLSGVGLSDVTALSQFMAAQKMNLSNNKISWITPFEEITWVKELDLSGNRISNISALSASNRLTVLNLNENAVTDLSPLAGKTSLKELHLNGNPIYHGHDALATLTGLQKLSLQDALVKDQHLSLLPMESLTELDLRNNKQLTADAVLNLANSYPNCKILSDFGPAEVTLGSKSFPATESVVDASYSSVIDLSAVTDFTGLTTLNLAGNGVSDFTPLKNMTALTELNLQATGLSDCTVLSPLTNLTNLTLSGNAALTDIAPLVSCTKLSTLYLDETAVTDVSALKSLTALTNLHLDKCAIADFSQLYELTSLKTLYILDCGITADALTALQQALPDCTIYAGDVADVTPESTPAA
ncbi:MAG: leucine-rich repeat domain-containing protein, partial [Oscillospiraceae bacterium]|nr:leucine-rich repeat domain-containing protein [Oscillospiraceae bacterium]